jgi:hypothetical protein
MTPKLWFPAKRYGWGWGFPTAWQGWAILATFFALLTVGGLVVLPGYGIAFFVGYTAMLCALLVAVCWVKGERPRWRWRGSGR